MRKIAIIKFVKSYDSEYDHYDVIKQTITNWEEVSNEEYEILRKGLYLIDKEYTYLLIEHPDQEEIINKTVKEYVNYCKKENERRKKDDETRKLKKEQYELKKKEKLRKQFEDLQIMFGDRNETSK